MKKLITICVMLSLVNVASATLYVEGFDKGKDSWNYGYGSSWTPGTTNWNSPGGNPDGYISGISSNLYAVWTTVTSPYGDMTGLKLTVDTMITDSETGTAQFYVGDQGTNSYYVQSAGWGISTDTAWTTHTVVLDPSNFTYWSGSMSFADVLKAPTDIGLFFGGGVAGGTGSLNVDNYGTIPEPATIGLLGLGALSLIRRKK